MRQIEVSRTLVLDHPRRARAFFQALVQDNLGIGRPDEVSLIFDRRIRSDTDTGFATRVVTRGVEVTVNCCYKHSRIKQYRKEGRALRVETVITPPTISVWAAAWSTWTSCRPRHVQPTAACWTLNEPVRTVSLRAQPLRGSHSPPRARRDTQPERCAS
ncbi:MAG TPA: hypothetical protein VFA45_06395, partial [Actinomycetes bacterium]|nr:hypothetical protein [Actinomycetes bacterium]